MSASCYAPIPADDADPGDDASTSPRPEPLTVSTVAATAVGVGHHMLKVEGYSRLKLTHGGNGSYLQSSHFRVGGHTWRILCCLNGVREEDAGFVSLYLALAPGDAGGGGSVVHAELELELVDHRGTMGRWPRHGQRAHACPFWAGNAWGFSKLISAEDLERSRFLRDDCFAVRCKVTVFEERAAVEEDVTAEDMERLGMVCECKDDSCKRRHAARPTETFGEALARLCLSICG